MKVSDCASQSESSHFTRSTNLKNEKKKIVEGTEWRRANGENGEKIRGDLIPGVENLYL